MEETMTTQSLSSANLLNQLNSFEFDSPLKVDVIFEDSDDEQESKIKIENISPNNANHADTVGIDQSSPVNNTTTAGVLNAIKEEHREENLKRKLEDEYLICKMSKTENSDKVMTEVHEKRNSSPNRQINPFSKNAEDTNSSTNSHIAAYVCNLLKALSRHLILIFESYYRYRQTRSLNNQALTNNAYQDFLRAKCHFFNLSFCTVANVILPEIRNRSFITRFLTDTITLAKEKNITLNLQSELGPIFAELVNWTRNKKAATDSAHAVQQSSPSLVQQLRQPPLEIGTKNIVDNQRKHYIDASISVQPNISGLEQTQQILEKSFENYPNINKNVNPFVGNSDNILRVATRDQKQFVIPTNGHISVNQNVTSHTNSMISQSQNNSMNTNASKSILFACGPPEKRLSISVDPSLVRTCTVEDSLKSSPNVVINQKQIPLQYQRQNLQQHPQFQKPQMLQQPNGFTPNTPFHLPSYPENNINSALQPSHQQIHNYPQQLRQNIQQHIPHHQNYRLHNMSQQVTLRNVQNSGHVPTYLAHNGLNTDQRQSQIPFYYQQSFQQQEHYQKQMSQQMLKANVEKIDRLITCPINNLPSTSTHQMLLQTHPPVSATWQVQRPALQPPEIEKPPPPYPIETLSLETEFQTFLGTNEIQNQTKGQQKHVVQSNQPLQCDTSKAEITRSVSTDSGFMSPLNFEPNKERTSDDGGSIPVITHITSLNPGASYIAESNCCICGKTTRKMCIGCYKKYYCSNDCQRTDWTSHMQMCKQNTSAM